MRGKSFKQFSWVCCMLLLLTIVSCQSEKCIPSEDEMLIKDSRAYFYDICIDSLTIHEYTIQSGENLSLIFSKLGLWSNSDSIIQSMAEYIDPKKVKAGQTYFTCNHIDEPETVRHLIFPKTLTDYLIVDFTCSPINVYVYQKKITLQQKYLEGTVKSSLWKEIKRQGVDPILATKMADLFAWQIDFFGLQESDLFRVVYTEAFIDDSVLLNIRSIDGAVFTHAGKPFTAIPFTQDTVLEYFDAEGQSLHKAFLKAPLDFFRISSHFSNDRFHPVLKRYRAHHGVDYAAPSGTPVKTIGSGKVIAKGFQKDGGGNFVKIQHNPTYTTTYMHLRGFAKSIAVGKQVQQGEIIGYVGSTGLSTGPHLDFRVYKNGKPIDPLKMESPPSHPVKPELRDSFEVIKQEVFARMDKLRENDMDSLTADSDFAVISSP